MMTRTATLSYCESTYAGAIAPLLDQARSQRLEVEFPLGSQLDGRYRLQSVLGKGGMGHVYLAEDQRLQRPVAVKVLAQRQPAVNVDSALAREARLGALLNHPHIATVFDYGVCGESSYTVFEYIEGLTLREVLERRQRLTLDEACGMLRVLAAALDFAHGRGIVHRDLKPENICATTSGQFKILDFGLARDLRVAPEQNAFSGTPAYAAPEQAGCLPLDGRADQYALGLIMYEALAGRRVFDHQQVLPLLRMHREALPTPLGQYCPGLPAEIERAVMRTLEKDPRRRFGTCQEFADAVVAASAPGSNQLALAVPERQRICVYLCHVSEDSLVVRQLSRALEERGYSTWYYQRDALPGVSFVAQTDESIRRARTVLLLISRDSLSSSEFSREIREAYDVNRPFLPVLVDLSAEEFASYQPAWRSMLGGAAVVELDRSSSASTINRLAQALAALRVEPLPAALKPAGTSATSLLHGQTWATDANQIDIDDLDRVVFRNDVVSEFLERRSKYFLSATKGLGKTLLLTYKRRLLTEAARGEGTSTLVPAGRPYLDFMSELKSLSSRYEKPLSQLNTCKRLWHAALRISLLSHNSSLITQEEAFELRAFPPRLQRWIRGSKIEPTVVFKELTSLSISEINRLIDDTENFLDQKLRMIHNGAYVFIDKVDQAVRQLSRAAWINVQAGLIEAAWDLMNANSHIKVFATIRHEAFVAYESDIKANLYGATTIIRYTEQELQDLLDNLARCYEGAAGFKDFVGLNVVKHRRRPMPEDSFRFLHRHTLGRPRDFVAIASELSSHQSSLNEKKFGEIVTRTSASGLVSNIFDEMHVFLDCLQNKTTRLRFLDLIKQNILSFEQALAVNAEFNGVTPESILQIGPNSSHIYHPFNDLYMAGLLGVVVRDPETGAAWQSFRQPDDVVSDIRCDLPQSPCYFVHPALNGFIRKHRAAGDYLVFQHVVVGEHLPWESYDEMFCSIEQHALTVATPLQNTVHALLKRARAALKSGKAEHLPLIFEFNDDWTKARQQLESAGHDDVVLWVEELARMKSNQSV